MMTLPTWIGIPGAVLLIAFIVNGFRQDTKVTTRQEGDPPEHYGGDYNP
jgi:hypothetical protein